MSRLDGKISRRYVKALFDVCGPEKLEGIAAGLKVISDLWASSSEFQAAIMTPAIPESEKEAVVRDVAEQIAAGNKEFSNFLALLLQNRRLAFAGDIQEALDSFIRELRKQLSLTVTSAYEVPAEERERISSQVQKEYGSLASIEWKVDGALIGGLRIQAGDRQLDNTVQTSLEKLRTSLLM